jgi:DsbC/DsbD-like thiol-disulfide interchange protein
MCAALHRYLDAKPALILEPKKAGKETRVPKPEEVVKLEVTAEKPVNGKRTVNVKLTTVDPWHIYANPTGNPMVRGKTTVAIRVDGREIDAEIEYPEGKKVIDADNGNYLVYEKEVVIKATFTVPAKDASVEIWAKVQACWSDDKGNGRCLQETTLKHPLK